MNHIHLSRATYFFWHKECRYSARCCPVNGHQQCKMFDDFLLKKPKPDLRKFEDLAMIYLANCDFVKVFPKLPSQLMAYCSQWQQSHDVRQLEKSIRERFNVVLSNLSQPVSESSTRGSSQMEHADRLEDEAISQDAMSRAWLSVVPPSAAPGQGRPVPTAAQNDSAAQGGKRCYFFPFCQERAMVCGGRTRQSKCSFLESRGGKYPDEHTLHVAKIKERNRIKLQRKRERKANSRP